MKITSVCHGCAKTLAVDSIHAGKKIRCPACQSIVQLPSAGDRDTRSGTRKPKRLKSSKDQTPEGRRPKRKKRPDEVRQPRKRKQSNSRKRPRRQKRAPDVFGDQPLGSYGPAIDEDDYEAYGLPPKRKKKNRNSSSSYRNDLPSSSSFDGGGGVGFYALVCGGGGLALVFAIVGTLVGGQIGVVLTAVAILIGLAFNFVGQLWLLANAFSDDILTGVLYFVLPFYAVYFLFSRWDENARPFIMATLGTFVVIFSVGLGALVSGGG